MNQRQTSPFTPAATAGLVGAIVVTLLGCATLPDPATLDRQALAAIHAGFRGEGIAKADRVSQDLAQAACSSDGEPSKDAADRVMAEGLATIKWPAGGVYFGDWREGEKIAQSGRGMTWTDRSTAPKDNGGSCYNCHELSRAEISFGTIGPSLHNYGKIRGVQDVTAANAKPIVEYTWGKLYNAKAYNACSNMPRFGHAGVLDESQLRHLMSLLLDPKSPVNQ